MAASQQGMEGQREERMELIVLASLFFLALVWFLMNYYQYAWYHFNVYFFMGLDFIPKEVNRWLFFWYPTASDFIPLAAKDLVFHSNDYFDYYINNEVGIRKKDTMDKIGLFVVLPFAFIMVAYNLFKELKRETNQIKRPSERSKVSALYRYAMSQADIWPYIKPVVNIMGEMVNQKDLDTGWYALSEIPLGWMKRHELLKIIKRKKRRELLTVRERAQFSLDRPKAYKVLRENLGDVWTNMDDLNFNYRCVLAVIVPHVFGRVSMSRLINRKLCVYHESGKSKAAEAESEALLEEIKADVDKILDMHKSAFEIPYFEAGEFDDPYDPILSSFEELDSEKDMFDKGEACVKDVLLRHCYVKTVMFALMERTWTYGVLASAEMIWIKKIDRDLWYVISQQGRTSAFAEVCGAWSHYLAEDSYGFRTLMPQLDEGLRALDYDLWSTHDNAIPHEKWDDQSKWDRLVPDAVGKGSKLPKSPSGVNTSKVV